VRREQRLMLKVLSRICLLLETWSAEQQVRGDCHEPSFSFSLFLPFNQTFNLDFPISCNRQMKDVSLGECGHYGWTKVSTPPEPPALVGPPLLIPTDVRTRQWLLPPAQKA